jgi:hypothetical protein
MVTSENWMRCCSFAIVTEIGEILGSAREFGRIEGKSARPSVTPLIAVNPAKCDKQESTESAETAGTSLTMSHFVLRSAGFASLTVPIRYHNLIRSYIHNSPEAAC